MKMITQATATSVKEIEELIHALKRSGRPFSISAHIGVEMDNIFALPEPNAAIERAMEKVTEALPEALPESKPEPDAPTRTEMLALIKRAVDKLGPDKVKNVLKVYGGEKLSAIEEGRWFMLRDNLAIQLENASA